MNAHLRANLWLLGLTVLLCCVLYPLTLWAIGQGFFPAKAAGSLLDKEGKLTRNEKEAVGSRLIGQPFTGPEYFQPRPSATNPAYNASASSGSNYGANNPKLRYRVIQTLGQNVKYRSGPKKDQLVGSDIEKWFQQDRFQGEQHLVAQWAKRYPSQAQAWVRDDEIHKKHVREWLNAHAEEVASWKAKHPDAEESKPETFAEPFFVSFSQTFPGTWPTIGEKELPDGKKKKGIGHVTEHAEIQANFFEMWLMDHPSVELAKVPADMVMASGSGLDPHITLANARYQLDRVVKAWAKKTGAKPAEVRIAIENLLKQKASAPLGGLAGVELINVLEVNLALPGVMQGILAGTGGNGSSA